ncbi:Outer membrane receptor proteins, mostly Fe transport [Chitinophaga jiangningensis]|uniref:Outer membrane receptor proteins, mostly Fe transport n=1 Tax=Chitinophaga jiangningensis TaxID=1419482 RepID=A0A1M6YFW2_9BACT|nr:outer membrane beta-barrel family protein [Chitinophaga jiangningensis]SHL17118.1 Outer membrane receptor proteins, mostly Fe transport [Chitinophaga jiangningensis]
MRTIQITSTILVLLSGMQLATAQIKRGELHGQVGDSLTKGALPNATVILKGKDTTFHSLSNDKGTFTFKNIPDGTYTLSVIYIGYKTYSKEGIALDGSSTPIFLAPDQQLLKGVKVAASKPFIIQRLDRIVLNVAESPVAAGGNAYDVVLKTPGMMENNGLQFRGKRLTVLIDGRNTNLTGDNIKEYLASLPSNGIDRIEVLPNPSAKYDATGGAAINIITVKDKRLGANGTLTAGTGAGTYARYLGGASINYRTKKLNLFSSYDYLHTQTFADNNSDRQLTANNVHITEQTRDIRTRDNHSFKAGMDYDINKRNTIGLLFRGMYNLRNHDALATATQSGAGISTVNTAGDARYFNPAVNIYLKSILDSAGKTLVVNADYFNYNRKWNDDLLTRYYDYKFIELLPSLVQRDALPSDNTIKSLAVDYTQPGKSVKLEAGAKVNFNTIDNDVLWQEQINGDWKTDEGRSNRFIYEENVNALYLNLSKTFGKFDVQAGVRAEQTNTEGRSVTSGDVNKNNYFNVFPNASVTFNQSELQQFGFSYQEKIDRPRFEILNPFLIYVSQFSYTQGNPNLRPSISHNFELSYARGMEWMAAFTYQHHQQVVADVFKKAATGNAVISTYDNVSSGEYLDGSVSYSKRLLHNKWSTVNNLGAFYAKYNGSGSLALDNAQVTAYFTTTNIFQLPQSFKLELSGRYYSPMAMGQYRFNSRYAVDFGLSKTILDKAGTITLNVSDVFNTLVNKYSITSPDLQLHDISKVESRIVKLQFNYKWGNKNVKASAVRKTGIETEKRRVENN